MNILSLSNCKGYQNMRNVTQRILLDSQIARLPIDIDKVCEMLNICVLSYDAGAEVIERAHLYRIVRDHNGLAFYLRDTPVILFNERQDIRQIMFTVAHELGHIILKHVKPGRVTPTRQEVEWNLSRQEMVANQFAAYLLAPDCVLWGLNVHTTEEIMELCLITRQAAEYRARRIAPLYERKKFLVSPVERALYRRVSPYICQAQPARFPEA